MNYYSFENLEMGQDGKYNLFAKTVINKENLPYITTIVDEQFKGRPDLLCTHIHGSTQYLEEFIVLNNLMNSYSLKPGMTIKYFIDPSNYTLMYSDDPQDNDVKDEILQMNKNKETKKDANRLGSPPTIKPDNIKQIDVNYSKKKITVLNKLS